MRAIRLAFLLGVLTVLGGAERAAARSWQGVDPGTSTAKDVTARFGAPTTQGRLSGRDAAVYKGDEAIAGTRQAQFFMRDDGVVSEVVVFPSSQLDREAVEGTYGSPARKAFTEDFRPVWLYDRAGISVFFGKDGFVDAIAFRPAEPKAAHPAPPAAATPPRASSPPHAGPGRGGDAQPTPATPASTAPSPAPRIEGR